MARFKAQVIPKPEETCPSLDLHATPQEETQSGIQSRLVVLWHCPHAHVTDMPSNQKQCDRLLHMKMSLSETTPIGPGFVIP